MIVFECIGMAWRRCRCLLDAVAFLDDCAPLLLFLFALLTTHLQSRELMFVFPTLDQSILSSSLPDAAPLGYIFEPYGPSTKREISRSRQFYNNWRFLITTGSRRTKVQVMIPKKIFFFGTKRSTCGGLPHIQTFRINNLLCIYCVYARRVNSLVLVCSLSSHRHSYIHLISSSHFIDSW